MSNPLAPLSSSYQNARAQSQMANSSPFLHKTMDQASENAIPSSPLKREWTGHTVSTPNAYEDNETSSDEPNYENAHETRDDHDINDVSDVQSYQAGASSPFQEDGHEDTVDYQKLRQMRQTSRSYAQLDPLDVESPASSPFRPNAREDTVDFQRLRGVNPMSPGLSKRLALGEPMSSPFRPHAAEDTLDFRALQEDQSSPLARPTLHTLAEERPQSSPFRPQARDETVDFQKLGEVQPMSPGIEKRLALEEPASSPFRPQARDETVDFQKLGEVQPMSPGIEKRLALEEPVSSPFRPQAREETVDLDRLRQLQAESPAVQAQSSPGPASSPFRYQAQKAPSQSPGRFNMREELPIASSYSTPAEPPIQPDQPEMEEPSNEDNVQSPSEAAHSSSPAPVLYTQTRSGVDNVNSPNPRQKQSTPSAESRHSSPAPASPSASRATPKERTIDLQKTRRISRLSLGVNAQQPAATTPRKRSYDQTPHDQEDDVQLHASYKKGMMSRPNPPAIHIDTTEDSIMAHGQSLSSTSAAQDRSAIGNSVMEDRQNEGMSTVLHEDGEKENIPNASNNDSMVDDSMDDTCLSTFSAAPDMTSFAKLRTQSPMKSMRSSIAPSSTTDGHRRSVGQTTPETGGRASRVKALPERNSPGGSPTPRHRGSRDMRNSLESNMLLDLTESTNLQPRQSMQGTRFSPSRRSPMRPSRLSIRSPGKVSSLLDFDIPPVPSPRSIPTVTPRELESLKSGFMSEISSLKATLSGKEAEVASLKQAVVDSERRVGEALEELRHECAIKEELEIEQAEWGRRGKEMETVLLSVQSQLTDGERERESLSQKVEEAEKSKEKLEQRIVELENRLSAARASATSASSGNASRSSSSAEETAREVQHAVEKVARELHTLYKSKHETKVAALKKSYESRWEKRLRESEKKLNAAREENEHLRQERDTAVSGSSAAVSGSSAAVNTSSAVRENEEHEAEKRVMEAQIQGLQKEMALLKEDTERIRSDLETERAEKGELVAAVDEWLAIQQNPPAPQREREASGASPHGQAEEVQLSREVPPDNLRRSNSRSGSGSTRPPATADKRIPRFGASGHSRGNSGGKSGIAMPTPGRGIMGSIERMGRGGV